MGGHLGDGANVVIGLDLVLSREQLLLGGDARERQARDQPVVLAEEDVRVEAVADHADAIALAAVLVHNVVDHERRGLAHKRWLLARAALDGPGHRAVARPLLRVGQVRHRVEVGGDELAALVLVDAELSGGEGGGQGGGRAKRST